jgi:hypothetical protein
LPVSFSSISSCPTSSSLSAFAPPVALPKRRTDRQSREPCAAARACGLFTPGPSAVRPGTWWPDRGTKVPDPD